MEGSEFADLMVEGDTSLDSPDLTQERLDRLERNRLVMKALDAGITNRLYPQKTEVKNEEDRAAIMIQKYFRGYMDRKKYIELLFQQFTEEEEKQKNKTEKQMEEGELLVENHQLEVLLDDNTTTRRNKARHYLSDVITIQRAWRTYVRRKSEHTSTGEIDDTEKDRDTEKEIKASSCKSQQTSNKNSCDIEKASFVNDRTISTSDFKLEDNDKNAIRSAADSGTEFEVADDNVRIVIEGCEKDKDRLVKDTQSVDSLSGLSDSTPEENTQHRTHDSTPEDDRVYLGYENSKQHVLNKLKQDSDADCVSIASDYSEVSVPLRELAESEVEIVQKADLADKSFVPSSTANSAIQRNPEETDEEFSKRVRKINLLSIAQEFADLKKVNAKALPFGLHKSYIEGESSSSGESSRQSSEMNTPSDPSITFNDNDITRGCKNQRGDLNSNISENNSLKSKKNSNSKKNDNDKSTVDGSENDGDFDVYNIETAVPNMDWEALERQLQLATQEEQTRQKAQRNDREEIRKKLAMASDVEEDCFSDDKSYRKTSSRALTGKNLQICFMNEDQDQTTEVPESSASTSISAEVKTKTEPVKTGKPNTKSKPESSVNEKKPHEEGDEDFFKKQARLQREARAALAQASTMAHMQLEVERQQKKKSPIAEIVGIPYIGDNRRQRVGLKLMYEMNVAQLQVVVNDLHTQIENLNEELVKLLMERDELHMSQDSMLVDIEDLSRRAEETAVRVNAKQVREHSKS